MIAYSYDKNTKQYKGRQICQIDPLETQKTGETVWLLPAYCTFAEPLPGKEGYIVIWNSINWKYKAIPEEVPVTQPTLEEVKEAKIAALKNARDEEEVSPIEYLGHYYDFDLKSYNRITAAADVLDKTEALLKTAAEASIKEAEVAAEEERLATILKAVEDAAIAANRASEFSASASASADAAATAISNIEISVSQAENAAANATDAANTAAEAASQAAASAASIQEQNTEPETESELEPENEEAPVEEEES